MKNTDVLKYTFGDIVYMKADPEQTMCMVVGINYRPSGHMYVLDIPAKGIDRCCFEIELTSEKVYTDTPTD